MAANIGGTNLLTYAAHTWKWGSPIIAQKILTTVGVTGGAVVHLSAGPCPVVIEAADGQAAVMKVSSTTVALASAAMDSAENAIIAKANVGAPLAWEDDMGRTGLALLVQKYDRVGPRSYSKDGSTVYALQSFRITAMELDGGPSI
jgi:hypothetical protein